MPDENRWPIVLLFLTCIQEPAFPPSSACHVASTILHGATLGAITSQLGISSGNIRIYKANSNRISGTVSQSSSDGTPYVTNFSVYSGVTSVFLRNLSTRTKSKILYTGALIATAGYVVNFDNHTYTSISIACTNSSSSNPYAINAYSSGNINFLIDNNVSVAISNGNSIIQFVFTSTGIRAVWHQEVQLLDM